jgi:hypothetical protein
MLYLRTRGNLDLSSRLEKSVEVYCNSIFSFWHNVDIETLYWLEHIVILVSLIA